MKLLVVTQALDLDDPTLSTYHGWVAELARQFEHVEVVCLKAGRHDFPGNVSIHSLGKEKGARSPIMYGLRFLDLVWRLRGSYDAVFVHMNQEYLLIAGWLWASMGKRMYLWRNHYAGSFLTDIAAAFCIKIFCTSRHSYTAKYRKTQFMPVGVDSSRFVPGTVRAPNSILFFGRISPSKRPELLIDALELLKQRGVPFTASIVGSSLPKDQGYHESLRQRVDHAGLAEQVTFLSGVSNTQAPTVFATHEIYVNASPSGMFDKAIFEAAASGCLVLATSDDFSRLAGDIFSFSDAVSLADRIESLRASSTSHEALRSSLIRLAQEQSLSRLGAQLRDAILTGAAT